MIDVSKKTFIATSSALFMAAALLSGCSSSSSDDPPPVVEPEEARVHDEREHTLNMANLAFGALTWEAEETPVTTDRYWGALDLEGNRVLDLPQGYSGAIEGHGYQIEVPENWNGVLVMYAHGYRGTHGNLTVTTPFIRKGLIERGYAWAASSYSKNWYDVRAGVEDTNALALAFDRITGRGTPSKYYIVGHSMGGHIAGAAVEAETLATANNVVEYSASMPLCGVMGNLSQYFQGYVKAAERLAGIEVTSFPNDPTEWVTETRPAIEDALWVDFDANPGILGLTPQGLPLAGILRNLSGGDRPGFNIAFGGYQNLLLGYGADAGNSSGILNGINADTTQVVYRWQTTPGDELNAAEQDFNTNIFRVVADEDANRLRRDGLRWIPMIHGDISVPVLTMHDTGDLFVPFVMQQEYARNVAANGAEDLLVQRAIRSTAHCGISPVEALEAFDDLVAWETQSQRPDGDDVLTPATLADANYGCQFTRATRLGFSACPTD
jgi:pimeloyl-ACP methyl ester carboxylesterase